MKAMPAELNFCQVLERLLHRPKLFLWTSLVKYRAAWHQYADLVLGGIFFGCGNLQKKKNVPQVCATPFRFFIGENGVVGREGERAKNHRF